LIGQYHSQVIGSKDHLRRLLRSWDHLQECSGVFAIFWGRCSVY